MSFKQMIRLAALVATIVIPLAAYAQQGRWADQGDETAQSLINMERQWAEAACDGNLAVQTILADDFQGTAPNGTRYPRAQEIQETKTSKHEAHGCSLGDTKVHFFGDNLAIVYGTESRIQKASDGKEYTRSLVWTDTWLKRNRSWQIVAAQDATSQASAQVAAPAPAASKVVFVSAEQLNSEIHKAPEADRGSSFIDLIEYSATTGGASVTRRTSPGRAKVDKRLTNMWYVIQGEGTLVTGGSLLDPTQTEADVLRGRGITDGEERHIAKGDFVRIPAGVPRWIRKIDGNEIFYLVVKVASTE